MTSSCSITCKTASGKSLEELSNLIALRVERMKEFTQDAVIATAIDVLKSLRTDTLDARKAKRFNPIVKARSDLHFSMFYNGGTVTPCIRVGSPKGPRMEHTYLRVDENTKGLPTRSVRIFFVTPEHERMKPYYLATTSEKAAYDHEIRRTKARIRRWGGLARSALGVAMAKLSTRNDPDDVGFKTRVLASNLSQVAVTGGGFGSGDFGLYYKSELDYGIPALKSGDSGVDIAMQKAANKIAGMLTHAAHKADDFEHDIETPFPEVRKAR